MDLQGVATKERSAADTREYLRISPTAPIDCLARVCQAIVQSIPIEPSIAPPFTPSTAPSMSASVARPLDRKIEQQLDQQLDQSSRSAIVNSVTAFTRRQIMCLPTITRWQLSIGLLVFQIFVLLTQARSFASLSARSKAQTIAAAEQLPVVPFRQMFQALRSLVLLSYFEHPEVVAFQNRLSRSGSAALSASVRR